MLEGRGRWAVSLFGASYFEFDLALMSQFQQVLVLEGPQEADLLTQPTPNRVELLILHIQ